MKYTINNVENARRKLKSLLESISYDVVPKSFEKGHDVGELRNFQKIPVKDQTGWKYENVKVDKGFKNTSLQSDHQDSRLK